MKHLMSNLDRRGIQGFFIQHGEKIALLIVIVLAGVFFALGFSVQTVPESDTPSRLRELASTGESFINDEDAWTIIQEDRRPKDDHPERVKEGRVDLRPARYHPPLPWTSDVRSHKERRPDPELFKPDKPEVAFANTAVAYKPAEMDTDLLSLKPLATTDGAGKKQAKQAPPPKVQSSGDEDEEEESDDEGDGEMAAPPTPKHRVVSEILKSKIRAYYEHLWRGDAQSAVAKGQYVVSVKAVVPWEKQWLEYRNKLETAVAYDPTRDTPQYIFFEAERAEATGDPTELKGRKVAETGWELFYRYPRWVGAAEEICDMAYHHVALTMPIPPVLMCNYGSLALHKQVKMRQAEVAPVVAAAPRAVAEPAAADPATVEGPIGIDGTTLTMPDALAGISKIPGVAGPIPTELIPKLPSTAVQTTTVETKTVDQSAEFSPPPVSYKLVRFFDLLAEPGKSYRYRVRVWLADPNNPALPTTSNPSRPGDEKPVRDEMLLDEVVSRLRAVRQADAENQARTGQPQQTYWRMTDWSDWSDVVSIPERNRQVLAGNVVSFPLSTIDSISFERKEPEGVVVASVWDDKFSVRVPVKQTVNRGSILNLTKNADVLHPVTWRIHRLENYKMRTDTIVLDMRGGESLPTSDRKESLSVPGEFLFVDSSGQLFVQNELMDLERYRMQLFIDDQTAGPAPMAARVSGGNEYSSDWGDSDSDSGDE